MTVLIGTAGLEDLRQIFSLKRKRKICKQSDYGQEDNRENPEYPPVALERLAQNARNGTKENDDPDRDEADHDLIVPFD